MSLTKCDVATDVIGGLGTKTQDRGGLTTQQFKDKFDEMPEGIKTYLNETLTVELDAAIANATSQFKFGSFTRDATLASGQQTITGLGFKPKAIVFIAAVNQGIGKMSIGFACESGGGVGLGDAHNSAANTWEFFSPIYIVFATSNTYRASVTTYNSDGFTLDWVKTGTPTGTISVYYIAMM